MGANRDALVTKPNGFFQVTGSSGEEIAEGDAGAARYVYQFVEVTGWRPDRIGLFGGELRFQQYGSLVRALINRIARKDHPEVDGSVDVEYTDREEVEAFADDFGASVEERLGEAVDAG